MYILIYSIYVLFVKMVCGEFSFKRELMVYINVIERLIAHVLLRRYVWILIYFIFYDKLLHRGITWFYGNVSNVVLRTSLWMDLFRGRINGWILYPRRGWCGWRFNHDGWVKWGCHDIATWLTQANTNVGYKNDIFLFYDTYKYYVCSMFFIYIYTYTCLFLEKHWWTLMSSWPDELEKAGQPEKNVFEKEL